jgi:cobaltochelatase CobT
MKVNSRAGSFIRSAPALALMFGRRFGVEIVFGSEPKTDGNTIFLPEVPFDADDDFITMMNGHLDHEIAHVRYTDFGVLKQGYASGPFQGVQNAIEDVFIEKTMSRAYPGCEYHLKKSAQISIERGEVKDPCSSPATALTMYIACHGYINVLGTVAFTETFEKAEKTLKELVGDKAINRLNILLTSELPLVNSTAETLQLTQKVERIIRDIEEDPSNPDEQKGASDILNDPSASGESPIDRGQSLSNMSGPSEKQSSQPQASNAPSTGPLSQTMTESTPSDRSAYENAMSKVSNDIETVKRAMDGLFSRVTRRVKLPSRYGKLDKRKLLKAATGHPEVYKRRKPIADIKRPAIQLLLDASGSMQGEKSVLTMQAAALLVESCSRLDFSIEVLAFSNGSPATIWEIKRFDHDTDHADGHLGGYLSVADGGTPLAEALMVAGVRLAERPEKTRLMFVVTDGSPTSANDVLLKHLCGSLERDFTVLAMGIKSDAVQKFFSKTTIINESKDIAAGLLNAIQKELLPATLRTI